MVSIFMEVVAFGPNALCATEQRGVERDPARSKQHVRQRNLLQLKRLKNYAPGNMNDVFPISKDETLPGSNAGAA